MGTSISAVLTVTTNAAGAAPGPATNLTFSNVQATQVTLTWTPPSGGPYTYQPQYRSSVGQSAWVNYPSSGAILGTSVTITGLTANTQYEFQILTSNGIGNPTPSAAATQITAGAAPSAPTNFAASATTTTTIHTSWTASSSGSPAPTYSVAYRTPAGSGAYTTFGSTTTGTSLDITGLTINTQYEFQLTATNAGGSVHAASTVTASTLSGQVAPGAPTGLTQGTVTTTSVVLSWTKSTTGTGNFTNTIQSSPTGKNTWANVGTTVDPTDTFTVPNLLPATTYDFRVVSSNAAGAGPASAILTVATASSGAVRNPLQNPSASGSMWVTPFGSGAQWSGPSDADTLSLTSKVGTVNADQYGTQVWIASLSDPLVTFTSTVGAGEQRDPGLTVTLHCPANATPAKPFPGGDCQMVIIDPVTDPTKMYCFGPCSFNNGKDVTGGVTANFGEVDNICGSMEDALTGNFGTNAGIGLIRASDLDPIQSPNGILHGLRFACAASQVLPPTAWDAPTNPTTGAVQIYWPQTHTDYNGPTAYSGSLPGGATVGIPSNVAMPSGLSAGGQLLWKNAQNFGWHWREVATSGVTLYATPDLENNPLIAGMRGDLAKIVPYLRVLRNQGPNSVQGGGTPISTAPSVPDPAICGAPAAPGQVTGVALLSSTSTSATLSWAQPTGTPPLTYVIQESAQGANTWNTTSPTINGTTGTINGLTAGANVDLRVVASNGSGPGTPSATLTVQLPSTTQAVAFDPSQTSASITLSAGNTVATTGTPPTGQSQTAVTSTSKSTGKAWIEFTVNTPTTNMAFGLTTAANTNLKNGFGGDANAIAYYPINPAMAVYCNNAQMSGAYAGQATLTTGNTVTILVDFGAKLFWVTDPAMRAAFGATAYNCNGSADPANGVGGLSFSPVAGPYFGAFNDDDSGGQVTINTGQTSPSITTPAGFSAWGVATGGGTVTIPTQATGVTVTGQSQASLSVSWSASTGSGGGTIIYLLESAPHGTTTWTGQGTTTGLTKTASGLSASTQYDVRVTASTSAGSAAPSAVATGTTAAVIASTRSPAGLLSYFGTLAGNGVISGQFIEEGPIDPINQIQSATGKWLGLLGGDYWHFGSGTFTANYAGFNAIAKAYWAAGGLITINCHNANPTTGGGVNDTSALDGAGIVTNGTTTNTNFKTMLDSIAAGLLDLQAAGVTVMFRPFHELNGNWFWWGTSHMTDAQFVAMWQYMHDYFVNTKKLSNILWVFCVNAGSTNSFPINGRYPGNSYVDILGFDLYTNSVSQGVGDYNNLLTYGKPVAMTEFGPGSPSLGDTSFDENVLVSTLKSSMPKIVYWLQWWDGNGGNVGWGISETRNATAALTNTWVKNRDDLAAVFLSTAPTGNLIQSPLSGTVQPGTWQLANYNGMYYWSLAPAQYDSTKTYPLILYLHQLDEGDSFYSNGNNPAADLVKPEIDPWFNNVAFRTAHPCFVLAPLLDMRADTTGNTINWGGVDGSQQPSQVNYINLVKSWMASNPIAPGHVYCTGNSMGGIGSWDCAVRYNAKNGTNGKIFAAFLILAGATYAYNYPNPTATMLSNLSVVPIWAIHGANDTQVPLLWDQNVYKGFGGSTAYNGAQAPNGLMRYTQDPNLSHDVWDTHYVEPLAETYWSWLFSQSSDGTTSNGGGKGTVESAQGTLVTTVGPSIVNADLDQFTLTSGQQVAVDGVTDTGTANVTTLLYYNHAVYHENTSGNWYSKVHVTDAWTGPVIDPRTSVPSGRFSVSGGQIIDPNGNVFVARGINIYVEQASTVATSSAGNPLLSLFPGLNCLRVAFHSYNAPSTVQTFFSQMAALGIVCIVEDHTGIGQPPYTGTALNTELAWYTDMASTFKSNPYVWFGTFNEVYSTDGNACTVQEVQIYNAIRNTGNTAPILMELLGGGNQSSLPGGNGPQLTAAAYTTLTNIIWDLHQYDYGFPAPGGYSTDESVIAAGLAKNIAAVQTMRSADGLVPVIIGEFGDSTDGTGVDPGAVQMVDAVGKSGYGFLAWAWLPGGSADHLTNGSNGLTSYGQQVAALIAAAAGAPPKPTALRQWFYAPGEDDSYWPSPFYSGADWITSGPLVTALRNGIFSQPTGAINLKGNYSAPWYIGTESDPLVTVTDGNHSIQVHIPLGSLIEEPTSGVDQTIGGADTTQPYLVWSISGASMNTGSVQASGSVITGTYAFTVQDGAGKMMMDAITGIQGMNNAIGGIMDYHLTAALADPTYVIPTMLAFQMDPRQASSGGPIWPLLAIDGGANYTGTIPQGITIGIPASTPRPAGMTRGQAVLFDNLQQRGWLNYNFGSAGCTFITLYSTNPANSALVSDLVANISWVMQFVGILNYANGVAGAQYSLATIKGKTPGATYATTPPLPLDLSPTGGRNVAPSTFGAWYPGSYNVTPSNTATTAPSTPAPTSPGTTIFPGDGGSLTDAGGNVWTLPSSMAATENGTAVLGGNNTAELTLGNGNIYGLDAGSQVWYEWTPPNWTQSNPPVTPGA